MMLRAVLKPSNTASNRTWPRQRRGCLDRRQRQGVQRGRLAISSGNRPMPIRAAKLPSHGHAVIIANGIAKAGPPARNSA